MKKIHLILGLLLILGGFCFVPKVHAAVVITTSTAEFNGSGVTRDLQQASDGSLIRFYFNAGHIYYATSTNSGTTWTTGNSVFFNDAFTNFEVNSFIDTSNNVYFTYNANRGTINVSEVKLTYGGTGSWSVGTAHIVASPNNVSASPSIIKDASGVLWDAYSSTTSAGVISVLVQTSTNDGVSWSTATIAANSTSGQPVSPLISLYNNSYPLIIYQDNIGEKATEYVSGTWTAPVAVDSNTSGVYLSGVSIGSTFMYAGTRDTFGTLNYSTYNGTSWTGPISVGGTASDSYQNQLTTDGTNAWLVNAHLNSGTTNYDIYERKWNGTSWGAGVALTATGNKNLFPNVPLSISAGGNVGYSWTSGTSSPFNINFDSFATATSTPASTGFSLITFLTGVLTKLLPGSLMTLQ